MVQLQCVFVSARLTLLRSQFSRVIEQSKCGVHKNTAANIQTLFVKTKKIGRKSRKKNKIRKIISRTSIYHTAVTHLINIIEKPQKEGEI